MKNIQQKITDSGLSGIKGGESGEFVCNISEGTQENKQSVFVSGETSKDNQDKVDALKEAIKALGCDDLTVSIKCKIGKG